MNAAKASEVHKPYPKGPQPVEVDIRICFAIAWYATEAEAMQHDKLAKEAGDTYNGGWFHGMACGRDTTWDREKGGKKLFAATF
jgi:hypothetical protein